MATTTKLTRSYFHSPGNSPLQYLTIIEDLQDAAINFPERPAFIFRDPERPRFFITFKHLDEQSNHVAAALHRLGIKKGDRVGIFGPNTQEWLFAEYGIIKTGAISVHITMTINNKSSLEHVLNKTGCTALLLHPGPNGMWGDMLKEIVPELNGHGQPQVLNSPNVPTLRHVASLIGEISGAHSLQDWLSKGSSEDAELVTKMVATTSPDDGVIIYLTGGSTGFPKAVLHSHFNVICKYSVAAISARGIQTSNVIFFNDRPFTHAGGNPHLTIGMRGSRVVLDTDLSVKKGNIEFVLQVLQDEKCTHGIFFPYLLQDILHHPRFSEFDVTSLKVGVIGGQIVSEELMTHALQKIPGMINSFASTECLGSVLCTNIRDPIHKKIGRIGQPLPHTEIKLIDENNVVVPIGTVGEMCARGPDVMICYYNDPEKTREAIDEGGWYHFGDLAVMDEEGYVNVVGRTCEVIKRATMKIYPIEVESTIMEHPSVEKVQAVGVPDARFFEEICACVQLKAGAVCSMSELEAWCRERFCPEKTLDGLGLMPKYFLEFTTLPATLVGKFDRREISKVANQRLNQGKD